MNNLVCPEIGKLYVFKRAELLFTAYPWEAEFTCEMKAGSKFILLRRDGNKITFLLNSHLQTWHVRNFYIWLYYLSEVVPK